MWPADQVVENKNNARQKGNLKNKIQETLALKETLQHSQP